MSETIQQILDGVDTWAGGGQTRIAAVFCVYVLANVLLVPATALTLATAFSRGFLVGAIIAHAGRLLAGVISFAIARRLLRGPLRGAIERRPGLRVVDQAVGEGGARLIVLLRLSPLFPSTLCNYLLGATAVRPRHFVVGTLIGTLPSTLVHAALGAGLKSLASDPDGRGWSPSEKALFAIGILATLLALRLVGRLAATVADRSTLGGQKREDPEAAATSGSEYTRQDSNLKPPGS